MSNHTWRLILALTSGALLGACVDDVAIGTDDREIVNGVPDSGHPAVVRVFAPGVTNPQPNTPACTGTLVGHNVVLTAAHCVVNGAQQLIEFDGGWGFVGTATRHPNYGGNDGDPDDIAVIQTLDKVGRPFYSRVAGAAPALDNQITLSGYGTETLNGAQDGVKRTGTTTIAWMDPDFFYFHPALTGPAGTDTATCRGDSGGPAYLGGAESNCVIGITKGQHPATCDAGGGDWIDSRLDLHVAWLTQVSFGTVKLC
jgi:hypothetical protein